MTRGQEATRLTRQSSGGADGIRPPHRRRSLGDSLQGHDLGGPCSAELRRLVVLGASAGIGPHVVGLVARHSRLGDADILMQPKKVKNAYIVSDSILKMRPKKTKARYQGPEYETTDAFKSHGCKEVHWSIVPGATIKDIALTRQGGILGWRIEDIGTIAMNDPACEESEDSAQKVLVESALIVVWNANDAYDKSGNVRAAPAEGYKTDAENIVENRSAVRHSTTLQFRGSTRGSFTPKFRSATIRISTLRTRPSARCSACFAMPFCGPGRYRGPARKREESLRNVNRRGSQIWDRQRRRRLLRCRTKTAD